MDDDLADLPLVGQIHGQQGGNNGRYGVLMAAVFVIGTMCGSGILAIPQAIVDSGWTGLWATSQRNQWSHQALRLRNEVHKTMTFIQFFSGIPLLVVCGVVSAYTGTLLGRSWTIIRKRYPEYNAQWVPDPYPVIGFRAAGKVGQYATRFSIDVTLFGGATVFVLLIAENVSNLVKSLGHEDFSFCYILIIVVCCMAPITWLGTPGDFWQAGVIACVTTSIGALLIVVGIVQDAPEHKDARHANPTMASFFSAFGTILYSFGAASCYPTIQVDMRRPDKFPIAVKLGISAVLLMYLLSGVSGFVVFGNEMKPNVLSALSSGWVSYAVNILITAHLLMAYVIISNPVTQEIEGFFRLSNEFSLKRLIIRTAYGLAILFVALTIPHFNIILSLIGGSTVTCTNFIFPPLFYLLLARQRDPHQDRGPPPDDSGSWMQVDISLHVKVILIEIIGIGIVGGISSTFFAFASLINGDSGFTVPCYVNTSVGL